MSTPSPDHSVAVYRPCYRSYIFSPNTGPTDLQFHFLETSELRGQNPWSSDDYFVRWVIDSFQSLARQLERPWMIFHGEHLLHEGLELSEENIAAIRRKGLNIFMYENLYIDDPLDNNLWTGEKFSRFVELEHISNFVKRHNIQQAVTVHVSEAGLDEVLRADPRLANLQFKTFSTYFLLTAEDCRLHPPPIPSPIRKKFICLNFRYEAVREMLVAFLAGKNYLQDSLVTFYHAHHERELLLRLPFKPASLAQYQDIQQGLQILQPLLPLTLEARRPKALDPADNAIPDFDGDCNLRDQEKLYRDYVPQGFVFAYGESRPFSPRSEISEKTIHPLFSMKPILPFAAPYFLKNLRALGFKTFSEFWDESFDTIECPATRFSEYLKVVEFIGEKSISELNEINKKLQPLLKFNRQWILNPDHYRYPFKSVTTPIRTMGLTK